jgi:cytochrome b pre-mRNA-processing protein 3
MLDFLNARTDIRRKAGEIYGVIVAQTRQPAFYAALGVPDTPGGRYEMLVAHLFLVIERLRAQEEAESPLPRLLVEGFIADMDDSLREMGTGDLTVPKKVRRAATGLYERGLVYKAGLAAADNTALADALGEHVYAGVPDSHAPALAAYLRSAAGALAARGARQVAEGDFSFPPVLTGATEAS